MTEPARVVFLLDVDNTLLDNVTLLLGWQTGLAM